MRSSSRAWLPLAAWLSSICGYAQIVDPAFGTNGCSLYDHGITTNEGVEFLDVLPDSSIATLGVQDGNVLIMAKYTKDGVLDTDFGTNGWRLDNICTGIDRAIGVGHDAQGRILAAGYGRDILTFPGNTFHSIIGRYHPDGTIDNSFGVAGYHNASADWMYMITARVLPDARVQVLNNLNGTQAGNYIYRVDTTGAYDTTYNNVGVSAFLPTTPGGYMTLKHMAVDSAGASYCVGLFDPAGPQLTRAVIIKMGADGQLDTDFGAGGMRVDLLPDSIESKIERVEVHGSRIYCGGTSYGIDRFLLALRPDGQFDTTFADQGISWYNAPYVRLPVDTGEVIFIGHDYETFGPWMYDQQNELNIAFGLSGELPSYVLPCAGEFGTVAYTMQYPGALLVSGYWYNEDALGNPGVGNAITRVLLTADYPTGIDGAESRGTLSVVPNPFHEALTVHGTTAGSRITLIDAMGRIVFSTHAAEASTELRPGSLPQGLYTLRHEAAQGGVRCVRVVVE